MGGFGSEYDLEKAGYFSVGEDPLTQEDRKRIMFSAQEGEEVLEEEYKKFDLLKAEKAIKNDENARPILEFIRNSVFTVLGRQGTPIITSDDTVLNRKEIKEAEAMFKQIEDEFKREHNPEYAKNEKWMLELLQQNSRYPNIF